MKAEIIAVGTELLLGDIINTNAHYLANQLAEMGFIVYHQSVVGDNPARLQELVTQAKNRSDIIIFSGGLGPTKDDLTKETVAKVFGDKLILDPIELAKIKNYFKTTNRQYTDNNEKQAFVPEKGRKIENDNGTAPGIFFEDNGTVAILLPGPPKELIPMFTDKVKPILQAYQKTSLFSVNLNVFGIGESFLEGKIEKFLAMENPTCALYAKQGEVRIRVTAMAETSLLAEQLCMPVCDDIKAVIGDNIYGHDAENLATIVVQLLQKNNLTVATAESCTGGMLSSALTGVSGSSDVISLGICSYSNEIKHKMLGVSLKTINDFTAVSKETACEMALGIKKCAESDFGVGITGYAGPTGGTETNPVGTVYIAVCFKEKTYVKRISSGGRGRNHVRYMACQQALDMLRRLVLNIDIKDLL